MRYFVSLLILFAMSLSSAAQEKDYLQENSFSTSALSNDDFTEFIKPQIAESQFVFLGEQHGIIEVGEVASLLFDLGHPFGFNTLCIETDAIAAKTITNFFAEEDPLSEAIQLDKKFHFSIPFYNNKEDQLMFQNVLNSGGVLWGIDQTLMTQFRLNFDYLLNTSNNESLKAKIIPLKERAIAAFEKTIREKDFTAPYIFQYDEATHQELMSISQEEEEKEIFRQFLKTKEIYGYNFSGDYYLNNEIRARLMKQNFMRYYQAAQKETEKPRVLFKLGAYHAMKGLTKTSVYDISNMGSELAIMNGMESLHLMVMGISGTQNRANPFEPEKSVVPIDVSDELPEELVKLANASSDKYLIVNTKALRPVSKKISSGLKKLIFKYDIIILIKEARAYTTF